MIEFAEHAPKLGLLGIEFGDSFARQPVEDAELLFAQAFVDRDLAEILRDAAFGKDRVCRAHGPGVGRGQNYLRSLRNRHLREPSPNRPGLSGSEGLDFRLRLTQFSTGARPTFSQHSEVSEWPLLEQRGQR